MSMHLTQGTFSYLPPLSDEEIAAQVRYCLDRGWSISIEFTDDPHPRNVYWDMWGMPMFDLVDPTPVLLELNNCRKEHAGAYVQVSAYDRSKGRQTTALSFIVNRPASEPGFRLDRLEFADRQIKYGLHAHATDQPAGRRYGRT
jgi:ribulose-bisphosphate carboxylase small chain